MAEKITITQGEDRAVTLFLVKKSNKRPFDLTGATEIEVKFPGEEATISKKMTLTEVSIVDNAKLGVITMTLSDTNTAALKAAYGQDIEVIIDFGTTRRKANLFKIMNVDSDSVI